MKIKQTDSLRCDYKIYLEPILATGCQYQGNRLQITRSKYVRYAVIRALIEDDYPLNKLSKKFDKFYAHKINDLHRGMTHKN